LISYSIQESIGKQIQKECGKIFPLQNVMIKKVKVLKKPKFDLTKLMELYQERPEEKKVEKKAEGAEGEAAAAEEPKNLLQKWEAFWQREFRLQWCIRESIELPSF